MKDTQKSQIISTDLRQVAAQAKQEPVMVFTSLAHRMDIDFLTEAYHRVRKEGAAGLSGVTSKDYKRNLILDVPVFNYCFSETQKNKALERSQLSTCIDFTGVNINASPLVF